MSFMQTYFGIYRPARTAPETGVASAARADIAPGAAPSTPWTPGLPAREPIEPREASSAREPGDGEMGGSAVGGRE